MTDREHGIVRQAEVPMQHDPEGRTDEVGFVKAAENRRAEEAQRAQFLAALDKIMTDHHNVLAALAK